MIKLRRKIIEAEIILANSLGTLGDWWAASAAHRLGKLSGELPSEHFGAESEDG